MIAEVSQESTLTLSSTVTGKNQVTIPSEIARLLKIESGIKLEWAVQPDHSIVVKRQLSRDEIVTKLEGIGREWKSKNSDPIAELIHDRVQDDREENLW